MDEEDVEVVTIPKHIGFFVFILAIILVVGLTKFGLPSFHDVLASFIFKVFTFFLIVPLLTWLWSKIKTKRR
tara:strand:+ start:131 stop:346 length:216 start_codon:yes stop_codon:yes gene_type:complete